MEIHLPRIVQQSDPNECVLESLYGRKAPDLADDLQRIGLNSNREVTITIRS